MTFSICGANSTLLTNQPLTVLSMPTRIRLPSAPRRQVPVGVSQRNGSDVQDNRTQRAP
jgi:hypothetical protein